MSREPGGSRTSADQTECARGEATMGEGDGGVLISGGDDEPVKSNMRTKRLGRRCRQASPRASSILSCHIVVDEEEADEFDADVEVEA